MGIRIPRGTPVAVFRHVALVLVALSGLLSERAGAQEMPAPVERQVALLAKVLQFDRTLPGRANQEVVVAVLYQGRFRSSLTAQAAVVAGLAGLTVGDLVIRAVPVELEGDSSPRDLLLPIGPHVVYVAPLRATDMADIVTATRSLGILSVTGVPAYVEDGVSIGISVRGARPEILINHEASLREGARLSSELLKLSRVIRTAQESD